MPWDIQFVNTCKSLNGQEYNFSNISKLNGYCYAADSGVGIKKCSDTQILEYQRFTNACAGYMTSEAKQKVYSDDPVGMQLASCVEKFRNNNVWVGMDGRLTINQKNDLDQTWSCRIEQTGSSITAMPWFSVD